MQGKLLRYTDLQDLGLVRNRMQLSRLIKGEGFPAGFKLSANARVWDTEDVEAWVQRRRQSGQRL